MQRWSLRVTISLSCCLSTKCSLTCSTIRSPYSPVWCPRWGRCSSRTTCSTTRLHSTYMARLSLWRTQWKTWTEPCRITLYTPLQFSQAGLILLCRLKRLISWTCWDLKVPSDRNSLSMTMVGHSKSKGPSCSTYDQLVERLAASQGSRI